MAQDLDRQDTVCRVDATRPSWVGKTCRDTRRRVDPKLQEAMKQRLMGASRFARALRTGELLEESPRVSLAHRE